MQSTDFYQSLLHLGSDWQVSRVYTNHTSRVIDVFLEYRLSKARSPETNELCPIYDFRVERRWRHLDTMQYKTYLHARVPRVRLASGDVVTIAVPWSEPHSHHSMLFEAFAIEMLLASKNQTQTAGLLHISFYQIHRIMERAVARGEARRQAEAASQADNAPQPTLLSIDEKSYQHGYKYLTIVSNAETGHVLSVTDGRSTDAALAGIAEAVPKHRPSEIKAVAVDMAAMYSYAIKSLLPKAQIVHDKFHLFQYLTKAIDSTRRDEAHFQPILKNTRWIWLKNSENRSKIDDRLFEQVNEINLKTAQAWKVRENFKGMYVACNSVDDAIKYFYKWKDNAAATMIKPVQTVVTMFDKHVHGIVSFFRHPITNARTEQLNSKIKQINIIVKGFRSAQNIRIAILFFLGKLNLLPQYSL